MTAFFLPLLEIAEARGVSTQTNRVTTIDRAVSRAEVNRLVGPADFFAIKRRKRSRVVASTLPSSAKLHGMIEWIVLGLVMSLGFVCSGLEPT